MVKRAAFSAAVGGALLIAAATTTPIAGQGGTGTIVGHVHYMGPPPVKLQM